MKPARADRVLSGSMNDCDSGLLNDVIEDGNERRRAENCRGPAVMLQGVTLYSRLIHE
jgi:hypothetical protein